MATNIFRKPAFHLRSLSEVDHLGDEFVVILEGEDYLNCDSLIEKLKLASTENTKTDDGIVIAVGMAVNQGGEEFTEVFRRADTLMYKNKKSLKVKRPSHNLR